MNCRRTRSRTLLFGGSRIQAGYLNDTWELDGKFWTQVSDLGPGPRWGHAMAHDAKGRDLTRLVNSDVTVLGQLTVPPNSGRTAFGFVALAATEPVAILARIGRVWGAQVTLAIA